MDSCINIAHCVNLAISGIVLEHGGSVVERRNLNREIPCLYSLCYRFEAWLFSFPLRYPTSLSCTNEYLAMDNSGENVSE